MIKWFKNLGWILRIRCMLDLNHTPNKTTIKAIKEARKK